MVSSYPSTSLGPVMVGLGVLVVGPALLPTPLVAALMVTPLGQAASGVLLAVFAAGWVCWITPGVSIRAAAPSERGES